MTETGETGRIREILGTVRPLAAEYYRLTDKPLGVTGEVAEYVAAELLGLELAPARTKGYDATRRNAGGVSRVQIKGRAFDKSKRGQRLGTIKKGADCDSVLLVLLENSTLEPWEMWEAPYWKVEERLNVEGSRSRDRGALGVAEFKKLATRIWPAD